MEKVIGLKVQFRGKKEVLDFADQLKDRLQVAAMVTDDIAKSKPFDNINKSAGATIKNLDAVLKRLNEIQKKQGGTTNTTARRTTTASTSSNTTTNTTTTNRTQTVAELKREILELQKAGKSYDDLLNSIAKTKQEQKELNAEIRASQREFEANKAAAGSYRQLNAQLVTSRNNFKALGQEARSSDIGDALVADIKRLDKELKGLDASIGLYQRNVGNYASAFNGLGTILSRVAGVVGIGVGLEEVLQINKELSDAQADTAKTTGLTVEQVQRLQTELEKIDTRTATTELLGIAEGIGRLGLNLNTEELEEFVVSVDKITVALGDSLGGSSQEIATRLAKISSSFKLSDRFGGEAEGIERLGAAINFLGANTKAREGDILAATERLQGLAAVADIPVEDILGISAALDEFSLQTEESSSAVQRFIGEIATSPEKFKELASAGGLTADEFERFAASDPTELLLGILRGAQNGEDGLAKLNKVTEDLNLTRDGSKRTLTALVGNYERFAEIIDLAGVETAKTSEEFERQNSLLDEFNIKNNTLAASVDKLTKAFQILVSSSQLQSFLSTGIDAFSSLLITLSQLPQFISQNRIQFGLLATAIASFQIQSFITQVGNLRKAYIAWTTATQGATIAQRLLNVAMRANPIGVVVTIVLTLAGALVTLYQNSETVRNGINNLSSSFLELYESNLLIRSSLFLIVEPLRLVYNVLNEGTDYFTRFRLEAVTAVENAREQFGRLILVAERFGIQVRQFLSFGNLGSGLTDRLQEIENEIKASNSRIEDNESDLNLARVNLAAKRLDQERENAAEQLAFEKNKASEIEDLTEASNNKLKELAAGADAQSAQLARQELARRKKNAGEAEKLGQDAADKQKRILEERQKIEEQAAKDRLKAAQNIAKLEDDLIKNRFDKQDAQARKQSEGSISNLIGSPEQIDKQTELITTALERQLAEIEKQRADAQASALRRVQAFSDDVVRLQSELSITDSESQISILDQTFQLSEATIDKNIAESKLKLATALSNQEIEYEAYSEQLKEIEENRANLILQLETNRTAQSIALRQDLTTARIGELNRELEAEREAIAERKRIRDEQIQSDFDAGDFGTGEDAEGLRDDALLDSENLAESSELLAVQNFEDEKLKITSDAALKTLELQTNLANERSEQRDKELEEIKQFEKEQENILKQTNEALGAAIGGFLTGQIETFEDFNRQILLIALDALEKQALLAISRVTISEISGKGLIGIGTAAILTGLIKAATAGLKSAVQSFEDGGTVSQLNRSGVVIGKPHSLGGVPIGNNQEIEGGEFSIRNGDRTHIVNKKSTRLHKADLLRLAKSAPSSVYSPEREQIASMINSRYGWGKSFASIPQRLKYVDGTTLFNQIRNGVNPSTQFTTRILNAPLPISGSNIDLGAIRESQEMIIELISEVSRSNDATNSRIDRLQVINKPLETLDAANEQLNVRNQISLGL